MTDRQQKTIGSSSKNRWKKHSRKMDYHIHQHTQTLQKIVITSIMILAGYIIIQHIIHKPQYIIQNIQFMSENQTIQSDEKITNTCKKYLENRSFLIYKYFQHKKMVKQIQKLFPIIKTININGFQSNTMIINIIYHSPTIIFKHQDLSTAYYHGYYYPSVSNTGTQQEVPYISLPDYIYQSNIHGIFHSIDEATLISQIETITDNISIQQLTYYPGGQKLVVIDHENKKIFFDLKQASQEQIDKLLLLKSHYPDYAKISEIDLGSLPQPIIKL